MVRERRILIATAAVAIGVPAMLAMWVRARTDQLEETLSTASGMQVTIGRVDADLTGAIRLSDVAFGSLVAADAIEASVAMSSLLGGQLRADEIRIAAPRLAITVDADGDSDLARLARRLAVRGSSARGQRSQRVRRIVVAHGTLTAKIAGVGELSTSEVEIVPDTGGVRVITGATLLRGTLPGRDPITVDVTFARSATEVAMPTMQVRRVLAVGGAGKVSSRGGETLQLADLAAGRLAPHGPLEIRAAVDDAGTPRPLGVDLSPDSLAIHGDRVPLRAFAAFAPPGIVLSRARGTGSLVLRQPPRGALSVVADASFEQLVVDHAALAPGPVALDGKLAAELTITKDAFTVPRIALELGAIQLAGSGWLRRGQPLSGLADLELVPAPCAALLSALPADVRGPLDGIAMTGELGARARLSIDLAAPEGEGAQLATTITGGCAVHAEPPAADVTALSKRPADDEWVSLKSLPEHAWGAFVSAEDGRFWKHAGFDLEQIARSLEIDLRERRLARGGSTISQQLVKNVFLTQRRSLDRKLQEAILTWRLETHVSKRQILERYLNIIELGPRIRGLRAAARYWFDTTPGGLNARQAAFLAALTSQPTTMSRRVRRAGGLDPDSAERVAIVLRAMRRDGVLSRDDYDDAKTAPLRFATTAILAER